MVARFVVLALISGWAECCGRVCFAGFLDCGVVLLLYLYVMLGLFYWLGLMLFLLCCVYWQFTAD